MKMCRTITSLIAVIIGYVTIYALPFFFAKLLLPMIIYNVLILFLTAAIIYNSKKIVDVVKQKKIVNIIMVVLMIIWFLSILPHALLLSHSFSVSFTIDLAVFYTRFLLDLYCSIILLVFIFQFIQVIWTKKTN